MQNKIIKYDNFRKKHKLNKLNSKDFEKMIEIFNSSLDNNDTYIKLQTLKHTLCILSPDTVICEKCNLICKFTQYETEIPVFIINNIEDLYCYNLSCDELIIRNIIN